MLVNRLRGSPNKSRFVTRMGNLFNRTVFAYGIIISYEVVGSQVLRLREKLDSDIYPELARLCIQYARKRVVDIRESSERRAVRKERKDAPLRAVAALHSCLECLIDRTPSCDVARLPCD